MLEYVVLGNFQVLAFVIVIDVVGVVLPELMMI